MAFVSTYFNRINTESRFGINTPGWGGNDFLSSGAMYYDDAYAVNGKYKGNKLIIRLLNSLSSQIDDSNNSFLGRITRSGYAVIDINHPRNNPHGRARHHYEVPYLGNKGGEGFREAVAACTLYKWVMTIHEDTNITKMFHGGVPPAVLLCEGEAAMGALTLLGSDFEYPGDLPKYFRGVVAISPTHGTLNPMDRRRQYNDSVGHAIHLGGLIRKSQVPGYVIIPEKDPNIPNDTVRTLQVFNNDKSVRVLTSNVTASTWPYGNNTWLTDRVKEVMMMPPLKKVDRDQDPTHRACLFAMISPGATIENPPIKSLNPNTRVMPASITKVLTLMTAYSLDPDWISLDFEVTQPDIRTGSGYNLKIGDIIKGDQLMLNLLIPSSNTAAQCIARTMGELYLKGGDTEFVAKMNELAKTLGVSNSTTFVNASGIAISGQYSTANDLAKIMVAAEVKPEYAGIKRRWNYPDTIIKVHGGPAVRDIPITRSFPDAGEEYISGVKTGTVGTVFNLACILNLPGGRKAVYISLDSASSDTRLTDLHMNYQRRFDEMVREPTKWGITT